jgi:hypothetical protein
MRRIDGMRDEAARAAGSVSVKRDATMAEVEEASSASGGAARRARRRSRASPRRFGPFSCTNRRPRRRPRDLPQRDPRRGARRDRRPARARQRVQPVADQAGRAFSVGACGSVSRTFQPARAKTRPRRGRSGRRRRWRRVDFAFSFSLTARAPCGADRDRRARPWTVPVNHRPRSSATVRSDSASARSR